MKVQADKLKTFLDKASLNGTMLNTVLKFNPEGLMSTQHAINTAITRAVMKKENFDDYEPIGEIGVKNVSMLSDMLKRYNNKTIELKIVGNKLHIVSDTGSSYYVLCDKEMCDCFIEEERFNKLWTLEGYDNKTVINTTALKDMKSAGASTLETTQVNFKADGKTLTLEVHNETGDVILENIPSTHPEAKGSYGEFLLKTIECLETTPKFAFKTNKPLLVEESFPACKLEVVIAPIVENE